MIVLAFAGDSTTTSALSLPRADPPSSSGVVSSDASSDGSSGAALAAALFFVADLVAGWLAGFGERATVLVSTLASAPAAGFACGAFFFAGAFSAAVFGAAAFAAGVLAAAAACLGYRRLGCRSSC